MSDLTLQYKKIFFLGYCMEIDYGAIGSRIRAYRLNCGLSQEVLSERADVTPAHFSHIERGNTKPSLPTLIRIANALDVSIDDLLCDNLNKSQHVRVKDVDHLLADCSNQEIKALTEILTAAKKALRSLE